MQKLRPWICGLLMLFGGAIARAQLTTATISGTVKDNSGAVMPEVKVSVENLDTGASRTLVTDGNGHYLAPALKPGNYRVTSTRDGFQTEVRTGLILTVAQEEVVDLSMKVGSITESVVVSGTASLVESTTASLGSLVDDRTIRALPLNGRSYDQLALSQPGVVLFSPGITGATPFTFGSGKRFSVGGQQTTSNLFLLDGTDVDDQGNGTPGGAAGLNLGVDTILEFKIFTNSFKAEYGHSSGSVITSVTRSGTNAFHGTAFEYIRNSAVDAKNYFDVGTSPPPFRRNQFGGVLGGPIVRNKSFFFGGYEGLRQAQATTLTAVVPTALAHQGILPTGKVTVNPAIVPYLNLYPLPNGVDFGNGTGTFVSAPVTPTNEDNVMGRVDYQLNAKTNLFGRYVFDTDSQPSVQSIPSLTVALSSRRQYATLQTNSILSPKALNSFRFAFNRSHSLYNPIIGSAADGLHFLPGLPLGGLTIGATNAGGALPLTPSGSPLIGTGPRSWAFDIWQWGDDFSYATGRHSFKTGVDIQRFQDNMASGQYQRGNYTFTTLATFLQAQPSNFTAASPLGVLETWGLRQTLVGVYGQDDYTVTPRLTLNLGLRWEAPTDPTDSHGQASFLSSPSATSFTKSGTFFHIGEKNWEPRLGLALRLDSSGKTVLRAAAGIYHNQILPWAYFNQTSIPPFFGRYSLANPPFPNAYQSLGPGGLLALTLMSPFNKTPADNQWNLSVQRQLSTTTVFQVAYSGAHGSHMFVQHEEDPTTPIFCSGPPTCPVMLPGQPHVYYPTGAPRLNPAWAGMAANSAVGNSSYNAVTATLRRQTASGLAGQIFYTYAKALDIASGNNAGESQRTPQAALDPFDLHDDWGLSDFNVKSTLVGSATYALPVAVESKGWGTIVNNWTIDAIATFESGQPFTPRLSSSVAHDGATYFGERPNLNPGHSNNPTHGTSAGCTGFAAGTPVKTAANWFDPCAFSLPATGTYGNVGRNTIIGPGLETIDLALEKNFKLKESEHLAFRFEMFNSLNHTNFGLPSTTALQTGGAANPSAGLVTYTLTSSRQLQAALRFSF